MTTPTEQALQYTLDAMADLQSAADALASARRNLDRAADRMTVAGDRESAGMAAANATAVDQVLRVVRTVLLR